MSKKIILSVGISAIMCSNTLFANSNSAKIFFQQAYSEIKDMLDGKKQMSFERAVFITENPYHDNRYSYEGFQQMLDANIYLIKGIMKNSSREDSIDFTTKVDLNAPRFDISTLRYTEKEKRELYRKTLANWSIFKYLTDTIKVDNYYHLPITYQINDPFGMNDWKNSQVINLLSKIEQQGNCFALVSLFKIFSDRLNSGAYICTAPQHIYIQHQDHKGDYYNVELATAKHPGDGSIQTLTYTFNDGIVSGISLRRLKKGKQNISLCLVNLGKSYEHKFKTRSDDFILQCAELALQYDSLNLNAMLLKEQVWEERVINYATQKNITDINRLKIDKGIASTYKKLENQIVRLNELGYYQMPLYMQEMILAALKREDNQPTIIQDRTPNPFPSIKNVAPEDKRYSTLSGGVFEEVREKKKFEQYGRFTLDTEKKSIVKISDSSNFKFLIDPVVFAWSVDPAASKMPDWSPYSAFMDNPVFWTDPEGDCPPCFIIVGLLLVSKLAVAPTGQPGEAEKIKEAQREEDINLILTLGTAGTGALISKAGAAKTLLNSGTAQVVKQTEQQVIKQAEKQVVKQTENQLVKQGESQLVKKTEQKIAEKFADPKFASQLEQRFEKFGAKNIKDQAKTFEKLIAEHKDKIAKAQKEGGFTSSMEREIRTFTKQLETTQQFIIEKGIK